MHRATVSRSAPTYTRAAGRAARGAGDTDAGGAVRRGLVDEAAGPVRSVRAVVACLAVLVWPPAARRLARPGSRRSRLLRWTGPGSAGTRRQATMSTPGRSR